MLDRKHVCFGIIRSGEEVIRAAEEHGVPSGRVKVPICITECGELREQTLM